MKIIIIGLEVCENFAGLGMNVVLVEKLPQVTPGLDSDMAILVEEHLVEKGVRVYTNSGVESIGSENVILSDGTLIPADIVIVAPGVRPGQRNSMSPDTFHQHKASPRRNCAILPKP